MGKELEVALVGHVVEGDGVDRPVPLGHLGKQVPGEQPSQQPTVQVGGVGGLLRSGVVPEHVMANSAVLFVAGESTF